MRLRKYRIFCIITVLLLTVTLSVYPQAFKIEATNEPLNHVLNRLGLEISFDDRALAEYSVTASMTFDNPAKALSWLLDDKPFRIEKIGRVYVIVPIDNPPPEEMRTAFQNTGKERFVFKGTVASQAGGEPLEYATVSLTDPNSQLLATGITTGTGRFSIQTSQFPSKIKISYLGYETLLKDIHNPKGELGVFLLNESVIELNETVITAGNSRQELNRTTYNITSQMRYGADNALELLNSIPGVSYDETSKAVRLNHQPNILLLVDGIQHPPSYLNHLAPDRVQAIEVVYALSGRFVSDDYAGIIHFILKKEYTGYDIYMSSAASFNLSKMAGDNRLPENRPSVGFVYTTRKLNFFGMYEYDREIRTMPSSKYISYSSYEQISIPSRQHNSSFDNENHAVTGGVNYHLSPLQLVGIQTDYTSGNTLSFQEYAMIPTASSDYSINIPPNRTENRMKDNTFTGALFYKGQVSNRLHLYGDFTYNYYYNDMVNEYRQDVSVDYRYSDMWDEYKNQTVLNMEAKYNLSGNMSFEAGYANIWRQYASRSSQGRGFLDYSEQRNKAFAYLNRYFSNQTGLKMGVALEHIRQRNRDETFDYVRALPFFQLNCKINRTVHLAAGYATSQSYPSLGQLSPISMMVDTFLTHIGNPALKSAVRHQAFVELTLWDKLKIMPQLNYISDGISEVYDIRDFKLYRTFEHVNYREYSLHASYEQILGRYFKLKNSVMLYNSEALRQGVRSALNGWTFHSEADYYDPRTSFGVQVGYYRNMKKNIQWQGYQMSDKDYWCVTARKELWRDRLSVLLSYIPPVPFGVRYDRTKEMDTPLYKEKTTVNLESYNQMLLLKVSLRFERGSMKPAESRTKKRVPERAWRE